MEGLKENAMPNYKLTLCYDGTRYRGWQRQGNTPNTIQEKVESALSRILDQPVETAASGRTDAGVHARAQVVSFRARTDRTPEEILAELRAALPADIGAVLLSEAAPRFHARLNAKGKTYVYRVWNSDLPDVFERRYRVPEPRALDLDAMRKAASALCGEHDFTSFCSDKRMKKSPVRRVDAIDVERLGDEVRLTFTGNGFLWNMVRILAGTLLEVGLGERAADTMQTILDARDRAAAGKTAPANGLILWDVYY